MNPAPTKNHLVIRYSFLSSIILLTSNLQRSSFPAYPIPLSFITASLFSSFSCRRPSSPDFPAQKLAHLGLGQHVPELDVLGELVGDQPFPGPLDQVVAGDAFDIFFKTTKALIRWPTFSSGMPTTQDSTTAGCS